MKYISGNIGDTSATFLNFVYRSNSVHLHKCGNKTNNTREVIGEYFLAHFMVTIAFAGMEVYYLPDV